MSLHVQPSRIGGGSFFEKRILERKFLESDSAFDDLTLQPLHSTTTGTDSKREKASIDLGRTFRERSLSESIDAAWLSEKILTPS
jgi:hypothetical protein